MDETDYTKNAKLPKDVYANIFQEAKLGKNTKFDCKNQRSFHDRSISILTSVSGTPTLFQVRLGKGLDFYGSCGCKIPRPNNQFENDKTKLTSKRNSKLTKLYVKNDQKHYFSQHYGECLKGKSVNEFETVRTDITIIKWKQDDKLNVSQMYAAIIKYNKEGDIGDLLKFKN
ncbi:hypothetical protein Fcan01_10170 [Folsomia candida]|uniref:Uncharacterized protein n=2 Tax=Folsomia candida TaxID=158441 RepID=A0A226EAA8_FOLCA|nr:hypothetical protein Fcan01_10170 [Folsomia candida]